MKWRGEEETQAEQKGRISHERNNKTVCSSAPPEESFNCIRFSTRNMGLFCMSFPPECLERESSLVRYFKISIPKSDRFWKQYVLYTILGDLQCLLVLARVAVKFCCT